MKIKKLVVGMALIVILIFVIMEFTDTIPLNKDDHKINSTQINKSSNSNWNDVVSQKISLDDFIATLTLEEKVGQLLMPDFREWNDIPVASLNDEIESEIQNKHIGGVILFAENFKNKAQTTHLISSMQEQAEIPLMISVDQEGGLVTRIPFMPSMPGNMALGATNDPTLAKEVGIGIGSELRSLGIHVNFGPVLDVNNNPNNPVIGVRAFGDDPNTVIKLGHAYMEGLNEAGVLAVGKHFPGHGDVSLDSHFVLPESNKTINDLQKLELVPFKSLIESGIQGIMTAHIAFHKIEPETVKSKKDGLPIELPATLSPKIITDILRIDLSFQGLIFTDAMDMKAVANHFGTAEASILAVEAGVDIVLMPENLQHAFDGIVDAVKTGRIEEERIDESVKRILQVKSSTLFQESTEFTKLSTKEIVELEQRVANASITIVSGDQILPLDETSEEKIALVAFDRQSLTRLTNATKKYQWRNEPILLSKSKNWSGKLSNDQLKKIKEAKTVIVATNTANEEDLSKNGWKMGAVQSIIDIGKQSIIVSTRNPYDSRTLENYDAYIAQYDTGTASFNAALDVLFGKKQAQGVLPVRVNE
ncbi:beta-N-acetylhexosaminidase [Bacillus luteolus]|uniref:Beta-N-acetylhexosaminidase n=1 Tax=Litchfieldia luteola TaxID=682179 RepID=A0ABR9QQT7_9BACI|nr:beta-N-acetylhexosaminidase [Cytobacillus luteolus]MBE4910559.1 beta-N-acetylhexosaminidase [Cytobacillus luteolus]MBP1943736.1 beta-N-acetylhexosaminidase [Cytobacillus luteolus]